MTYSFENEFLKVTADTHGAELVSVVNKETGAEMMWNADPEVWNRHAPVLFPYCGNVKNHEFKLDGKTFTGGQHGFMRDMEHTFAGVEGNTMHFVFEANEDSLARFPRKFRFETIYTLEGRCLTHTVKVTNMDEQNLRFGLGYHPGFAFPFDDAHKTEDYELRFDVPQTPIVRENESEGPNAGFVSDRTYAMVENSAVIPLNDRMFDNDSMAMSQMTAKTLSIVEKDTGRKVVVNIEGFPYVLLWSKGGLDALKFICIEPWYSLQDVCNATGDWNDKACAADLKPGEEWTSNLAMTFDR